MFWIGYIEKVGTGTEDIVKWCKGKGLQDPEILISMTESGNPRENAIAERVNGILKTEWLNDEHFIGMFDARRRITEVIDIYNNKRPHMSLDYSTPREAHKMHGEQVRRWKNYYKTNESPSFVVVSFRVERG